MRFNKNDILVHAHGVLKSVDYRQEGYSFAEEDFPGSVLSDYKRSFRESGIHTLCLSRGVFVHNIGNEELNAPVWLYPLDFKRDKIKKQYQFSFDEEEGFINPFILYFLSELEVEHAGIQSSFETAIRFLAEIGLETNFDRAYIGNFHHHRYDVIRELEELECGVVYSSALRELMGDSIQNTVKVNLVNSELYPSDSDHCKVYELAGEHNCVIQGPPGTGKSQVLTNLAGKLLFRTTPVLFVSEKKAALDVIVQKLKLKGLDKFAHITSSGNSTHVLLRELKDTWAYLEQLNPETVMNLQLSKQYEDQLQMIMDMLRNNQLIGGVSYYRFLELAEGFVFQEGEFNSSVPDLNYFEQKEEVLKKIYSNGLADLLGRLKVNFIQDREFGSSDQKIRIWLEELEWFGKNLHVEKWSDIAELMKKAAFCQVYENELYKKHVQVFSAGSAANKKFLRLYRKWKKIKLQLEAEQSSVIWKRKPTRIEIDSVLSLLNSNKFLDKRRARKIWGALSDLPTKNAPECLNIEKKFLELSILQTQVKVELCEIGIVDPELEIDGIYLTFSTIPKDRWKELEAISTEERTVLLSVHHRLNILHEILSGYFSFNAEDSVINYFKFYLNSFSAIYSLQNEMKNLNRSVLDLLRINSTFDSFKQGVLHSHWIKMSQRFPVMAEFNFEVFKKRVEKIIATQDQESELFAREIEQKIYNKWNEYNKILSIPASKLKPDEREFKKRLKKGKSILVKEFAKSRNHPSLRELFQSEAREWIQLLKPLWLSNPVQLSKCFPIEQEMFEFTVFDEASQIPLEHALGAVQRSGKVIIAGDEQQMSPSFYFTAISGEVIDLLHQASFYLPKVMLTHHYRSLHPDLIAFSNRHFYNNQLQTFPSCELNENPLNYYYNENGRYENRRNDLEARQVAVHIEKAMLSDEVIGVVAFSEEQLNCIYGQLSQENQSKLIELSENDRAFFKTLENVQGDECDNLIISFGYGYNTEGKFRMQFGPMNRQEGTRRLNVLLTRARKAIHFYASVKASDFKISDNESVDLLRQWFIFIEKHSGEMKYQAVSDIGNNVFELNLKGKSMAREVYSNYRVLKSRGWEVLFNHAQ